MEDITDHDDETVVEDAETPSPANAIARELLPVSLETEMKRSYLDYAMSVIVGRALPDVRDGLKPVHRRVLFAMNEIKNTHNNPHKKAARVVGEVLGKYHPHGDAAAYMTIVRMAQPFSLRYPLVDGQGNFGSIDGDNPAAMRYTEVRLEKIASTTLADINEETVDFTPNFDNSEMEPVVLPTRLPQLLVNGSSGIAVGMATNIPPHNVRETIEACLHFLEHPDCTVDDLIPLMPAPDFPTGGIIFGLSEVHQGYRTGRGRVVIRARTHLEEWGAKKDRTRIVVDEIPYMINKRALYERMHELVRDKKLEGIAEMRDESTEQIRICIDLKQGAMPEVVLNNLFKLTNMQSSFGMNMVALVDGQPMLLNLKQLISHFVAHRREVVTRRTVFRLRKVREAGHVLEGQAVALANLDEFIRIIRASKTPEEASAELYARAWPAAFATELVSRAGSAADRRYPDGMELGRGLRADGSYLLTKVQVDNILAMNLRRLTGLEQDRVRSDYETTMTQIIDYLDILARPERVNAIIGDELREIRDTYGDERRSTIDVMGDPNFNERDLIPRRNMVVTLTRDGYVKSQELADYNAQARGGKGRKMQTMTRDDAIEALFIANSHDIILCFTTSARVYALDVFKLPEGKANSRGRPVVNLLPLEENEHISFMLPIAEFSDDHYVVMATNRGIVKKTPLSGLKNARLRAGLRATTLDEGEHLVSVGLSKGDNFVMLVADTGYSIRFPETNVRSMGRTAHGVKGIRLSEGASVVSMLVPEPEDERFVLLVTEKGYGKRVPVKDFRPQTRGGQGLRSLKNTEERGNLVAATLAAEEDDIMILSTSGKVVRTRAREVPVYSRYATGVRLIRVDGEEQIVSLRRVERTGDEEDDDYDRLDLDESELEAARLEEVTAVEDEPEEVDVPLDDESEEDAAEESDDLDPEDDSATRTL